MNEGEPESFRNISRPGDEEYSVSGLAYSRLIPDGINILQLLYGNFFFLKELLMLCTEEQLLYKYDSGKWTIKETLVHLIDDERIYSYRALCIGRNENQILPGFDQDNYVFYSNANQRTLFSIFDEYRCVRMATLRLFNNLPEDALLRKGYADHSRVSVRALVYHIAGHELHHLEIVKGRYNIAQPNDYGKTGKRI